MVEKYASNEYPINELLRKRWSPRAFSDQPIEPEKILSLLEAARWSPSCFNEQPWSFIMATKDDADEFERLLSCLADKNRMWTKHAPLLMLSVAKLHFEHNGKPNRHALHDVGLAVGNLIVQATELNLYTHQMAGFHIDKARELYQIPETHEPVAAIAIGYRGESHHLTEEFQKREKTPRTRKELFEFVYAGSWNQTASILVK
jgi:nitroreductase